MIYYLIALLIFGLDQLTKWLIKHNMEIRDAISVIGEFFIITSHRNEGAAFGILQGQRAFIIIVTSLFLVGIIWYLSKMIKENNRRFAFALSLILGGAVGNFLDRTLYGEVVDFLQFTFKFNVFGWNVDYIFPIFNIADSAIVIGTILVLLDSVLAWRQEVKAAKVARKDATHDGI